MLARLHRATGVFLVYGALKVVSASTFTVSVFGHPILTSSGPVADVNGNDGAFSGNGTVKARSFVGADAPNAPANNFVNSGASASSVIDDLVITGPAAFVQTSLQLFYHAVITVRNQQVTDGTFTNTSGASGDISLGGFLGCFTCVFGGLNGGVEFNVDAVAGGTAASERQGTHTLQLDDLFVTPIIDPDFLGEAWAGVDKVQFWGVTGNFDSGAITLPTNTFLTLSMNMTVSDLAVGRANTSASAGVNAFNTFGLPIGTPVFDLPAGFTANAPSIGLVDNIIPAASAPEPMPMGLAAAGLAFVGMLTRRPHIARKRRS